MSHSDQHALNSGFGLRTEPAEIMEGVDLTGRTAIVTGGYSGIGLETTRALAAAGASVTVPVRDRAKAEPALAQIEGDVHIADMDLSDLASVRTFTSDFAAAHDRLHLLINNAGVMACPLTRVGKGWELQFATNHIGHFVLTRGLTGLLKTAAQDADRVRVVALSSIGHRISDVLWDDPNFDSTEYNKWVAYGQSKSANALFAVGLDTRLMDLGVRAFSVHPGGIMTPLQRHLETEEMAALGWVDEHGNLSEAAAARFKTPTQGCSTTLWAATSPLLDGMGGLYCEDCDVAEAVPADSQEMGGIRPWAVSDEGAERLWEMTEAMLADA